jgi:hypothetical protein
MQPTVQDRMVPWPPSRRYEAGSQFVPGKPGDRHPHRRRPLSSYHLHHHPVDLPILLLLAIIVIIILLLLLRIIILIINVSIHITIVLTALPGVPRSGASYGYDQRIIILMTIIMIITTFLTALPGVPRSGAADGGNHADRLRAPEPGGHRGDVRTRQIPHGEARGGKWWWQGRW